MPQRGRAVKAGSIVMSEHRIALHWSRDGGPFARGNYRSNHEVRYSGGQTLKVGPSPDLGGDPALADPEQMLLSALSSCHMLTFLAVAANRGYVVDSYSDDAVAVLGKNEEGKTAVVQATLAPKVTFSGDRQPTADEYAKLHERAHMGCFIANSVKARVDVQPT
jgi:organic hydroperoxide reductase OsmC/OhrA